MIVNLAADSQIYKEMKGIKPQGKPWTQNPFTKPTLGASPREFHRLI